VPSDPAGRSADSDGSSEGVSRIQVSFLRVRFAKVYQEFLQIFAQIPEPAPGIWPFLRHPLPPVVATPTPIPSVRPGHPLPDARNLQRIAPFLVVGTGAAASHADVSGLRTQGILRSRPRSSREVSRNRPVIPEPDAHTSPPLCPKHRGSAEAVANNRLQQSPQPTRQTGTGCILTSQNMCSNIGCKRHIGGRTQRVRTPSSPTSAGGRERGGDA